MKEWGILCYNDLQNLANIGDIFICFFTKARFGENQNG